MARPRTMTKDVERKVRVCVCFRERGSECACVREREKDRRGCEMEIGFPKVWRQTYF